MIHGCTFQAVNFLLFFSHRQKFSKNTQKSVEKTLFSKIPICHKPSILWNNRWSKVLRARGSQCCRWWIWLREGFPRAVPVAALSDLWRFLWSALATAQLKPLAPKVFHKTGFRCVQSFFDLNRKSYSRSLLK